MGFYIGSTSSMSVDDSLAFKPQEAEKKPLKVITEFFTGSSASLQKSRSTSHRGLKRTASKISGPYALNTAAKLLPLHATIIDMGQDLPASPGVDDLPDISNSLSNDSAVGSSSNDSTSSNQHRLGVIWSGLLSPSQLNEEAHHSLLQVKKGDTIEVKVLDKVQTYTGQHYTVTNVDKWQKNIHDEQIDGFKHQDLGLGQTLKQFQNGNFRIISIKAI